MPDYFEMERVIEELVKSYPAKCETTWFQITKNPAEEEYRDKAVEYIFQSKIRLDAYIVTKVWCYLAD